MQQDWFSLLAPAAQDRLVLLLNHVLSREAVATARLKPHQGARVLVELQGWPTLFNGLLPAPPALALQITPAGLLERLADVPAEPSLRLCLQASNPVAMALGALSGQRPEVGIQGNAALASDMNWLMQNLRWDIEDDLAQVLGAMPAHELTRLGKALAAGLAAALSQLGPLGQWAQQGLAGMRGGLGRKSA